MSTTRHSPAHGPGSAGTPADGRALPSAQDPGPGPLIEPGRQLSPAPGRDRPWRVLTVLLGATVVMLVLLGLAAATTATWLSGRGYAEVPATTALGAPTELSVRNAVGTVRVLPSADVDEVTLALVPEGETTLPGTEQQVRARIQVTDSPADGDPSGRTAVEVRQPERYSGLPWTEQPQNVLVLVPADHEMALEVRADVGDLEVDGAFTSLEARTDVGNLRLSDVTAAEGISAQADLGEVDLAVGSPSPPSVDVTAPVGDVALTLPTDASGTVAVATEVGSISVTAPGTNRWQVEAGSDLGDVHVDPGLTRGEGQEVGEISATSDLGSIDISR